MKRNVLGKKCFERDNFACQKCKIGDKTEKILETHHKIPLVFNGKDALSNLIILCSDYRHFAPNNKKEFEEYLNDETQGTLTNLIKAFQKVREKHPNLIKS